MIDSVSDVSVAAPGHRWTLELPDDPVEVRGDAGQLRQVLINLLSNAHKHTDAGTAVATSLTALPDGGAQIRVVDNGPGIPPGFLERIFSRFAQADAARSAAGSSGLGLAIAEAIVNNHGGSIGVAREPGRIEFTVLLPAGAGVPTDGRDPS